MSDRIQAKVARGVEEVEGECHPSSAPPWRIWVDTGGTFTDCLALDPAGELHRVKVLSSSALRGAVGEVDTVQPMESVQAGRRLLSARFSVDATWRLVPGFADGAALRWLDRPDMPVSRLKKPAAPASRKGGGDIESGALGRGQLELESWPESGPAVSGERFELRFDEEAPVLAARLITGSARVEDLPPMEMRLATTRGTNALLERRGARTLFLVTEGFADLLLIGDQRRPDLFALAIDRPEPFYERVIEIPGRLSADGEEVHGLDLESVRPSLLQALDDGMESVAIALMHSYAHPRHERALAEELRRLGFSEVSISSELAPSIGILARAETAVVDAYLAPVIQRYLSRVQRAVEPVSSPGRKESPLGLEGHRPRLHVMTSAGGLVGARRYRAKDSLLSGPAGGVVGAAASGRRLGFERLVAFDMGGTSTDVSRFDGDFEYRYQHRVAGARIAVPMLAIETVAAGGGSICWHDGPQLKVGPHSAGADPGPACYGAGGPLTLTDVNLLLGRLSCQRFGIPLRPEAAQVAAAELLRQLRDLGSSLTRDEVLQGFLDIANQRMADAVQRISVRQGYDPRDHALVAFGGAGGQHACAVADHLGLETVILPREAGLLSALGLGAAVMERIVAEPVLAPLQAVAPTLDSRLHTLTRQAIEELEGEGVKASTLEVRRRSAFLRLAGQESSLEVAIDASVGGGGQGDGREMARRLAEGFVERYRDRFGFAPSSDDLELESLRVTVSTPPETAAKGAASNLPASPRPTSGRARPGRTEVESNGEPAADKEALAWFDGHFLEVPIHDLEDLESGAQIDGPALIFDSHASLTLESGWVLEGHADGLVCRR